MAAAASSTLQQGSNFTNAHRVPRTSSQQRIPSGLVRRSAPSSLCFRAGSERTAAVVRAAAAAAAGDGGAPAVSLPAALLFDCDGVLVDTEKDGHRISFNEAFAERELGVSWDVELYGELLEIGGGKERMTAYFNKTGWPAKAPKTDEERKEFIASLHKRKTELFMALIEKKLLPLRPGVQRLTDEALGKEVKVAVGSTSNEKAVSAIVSCLLGLDRAEKITIFAGDVVPRKKPNPAIYVLAATTLGVDRSSCVVVEDSTIGLAAAKAAGMKCIVTKSGYTAQEDFATADAVFDCIGDPPEARFYLDFCAGLLQKQYKLAIPQVFCHHLVQLQITGRPQTILHSLFMNNWGDPIEEEGLTNDIPTTLHRSKADCPVPEEMVTVSVDGSVLDRIAKIMTYLRLGSSGKVLKKKKKERDTKGKSNLASSNCDEAVKPLQSSSSALKHQSEKNMPPPPLPPRNNDSNGKEKQSRADDDDIFVGDGVDYSVPNKEMSRSPISEDMEESPRNHQKQSYFAEPMYGPVPPSEPAQAWQQPNGYDTVQAQMVAAGYQGDWSGYVYAEQQLGYPEQYVQQNTQEYDVLPDPSIAQDPRFMTQADKDRGLGSVFKRDDQRLNQLREKDAREKDPNFISDSYSECYPGYQEYHSEIAGSDDEDDLSKMDMGGRAKGRLHRWDFETEEEWAKYNDQKEAMPKAAFQFGVKMQDGRKTRKQNKDQKLTNDLHKINKILARKKGEKDGTDDGGHYDDDLPSAKKQCG